VLIGVSVVTWGCPFGVWSIAEITNRPRGNAMLPTEDPFVHCYTLSDGLIRSDRGGDQGVQPARRSAVRVGSSRMDVATPTRTPAGEVAQQQVDTGQPT
jgi:hypothetical protein